ncbi:MerR family transcriptional regulator, partial [Staphylococcus epidermidis]|uniref:MerR family transcriptional regulator n=1 Tax=Staphylococcus epidermidis TaxID=1282 RepID=UPI00119E2A52
MSIYTSRDIAHKSHLSTPTIHYYHKQPILSPNYTTQTNTPFYTHNQLHKLQLILLLNQIPST